MMRGGKVKNQEDKNDTKLKKKRKKKILFCFQALAYITLAVLASIRWIFNQLGTQINLTQSPRRRWAGKPTSNGQNPRWSPSQVGNIHTKL